MSKTRNLVFVAIIAVCLFSVIGYKAVIAATPLTAPQRSTLEGREYQTFPKISDETVSSGGFQDDFEQYVADLIPQRDAVLLTNAALQRKTIELANVPFGYKAYPTFFGSDRILVPEDEVIYQKPQTKLEVTKESLNEAADKCSAVINSDSDVDWAFYLVDRSASSAANPAHSLSANVADYDYLREELLEKLPESCAVVDGAYYDFSEFKTAYFRTDHHWQIMGGVEAYRKISAALGNEPIEFDAVNVVYPGPFWGSNARRGLACVGGGDIVYDVEYSRSSLEVKIDGKRQSEPSLCAAYDEGHKKYHKDDIFSNVYADYFHNDYGLIEIENAEKRNGKSLLIVSDSFSNNIERFFAENYQNVYVLDMRFYKGTVKGFLEENDVDDGVFIWQEVNL